MTSETWASPAARRVATREAVLCALAAALFAAAAPAQTPTAPPGFGCPVALFETSFVPQVRSWLRVAERAHVIAIGPRLHLVGDSYQPTNPLTPPPLFEVAVGDDVAFVAQAPAGRVYAGERLGGKIAVIDPANGLLATFLGVRNTFDVAPIGADLLLSANPLWPQGGATSGVWLAGPGRTPRELLPLIGPSGPLVVLSNGDLVVAELGPIVPPPPGATRLLRIPAANLQAAIGGGTLSMADVAAIGTGFGGIYDVARDDEDRLFVTDSGASTVLHTTPGGLTPAGTLLDAGPGRFVLGMQFVAAPPAPLRGFQPPDAAPRLLVATSDFWSLFEVRDLHAVRPSLVVSPSPVMAQGNSHCSVTAAPPSGLAILLAAPPAAGPEVIVATFDGSPLWLGLPVASCFVAAAAVLNTNGDSTLTLTNPGGVPGRVDLQVVALGAAGSGELGSSPVLPVLLLP